MFGLSIPMRMGLDSVLDQTFFSAELFRFSLLVIGVSAFIRPMASFSPRSLNVPTKTIGEKAIDLWAKRFTFAASWTFAIFVSAVAVGFFLDRALIFPFFLFLWLYIPVTIFFYSSLKWGFGPRNEFLGMRDYLERSLQWKSYLSDQVLLMANLSLILASTATFGYLRTITLSLSHQYCITH